MPASGRRYVPPDVTFSAPGLRNPCGGRRVRRATSTIGQGRDDMAGSGTKDDPWQLKTAPGTSEYQVWRGEGAGPPPPLGLGGGAPARRPPPPGGPPPPPPEPHGGRGRPGGGGA